MHVASEQPILGKGVMRGDIISEPTAGRNRVKRGDVISEPTAGRGHATSTNGRWNDGDWGLTARPLDFWYSVFHENSSFERCMKPSNGNSCICFQTSFHDTR